MHGNARLHSFEIYGASRAARFAVMSALVVALVLLFVQRAHSQTFQVLYSFTGGAGGAYPSGRLALDQAGNLYGATLEGGILQDYCLYADHLGCGTVFKLIKSGHSWVFVPLYFFHWVPDGEEPIGVSFGRDGSLYGTTSLGPAYPGGGTVLKLNAPATVCKGPLFPCWAETVLYGFTYGGDPSYPNGDLVFDAEGNIYGTTSYCGASACGAVYELSPSGSGWLLNVIYPFTGGSDGGTPYAGVIFDQSGNLYGTTYVGGAYGQGVVYELVPSNGGWKENVLYSFTGGIDGGQPSSGLILDQSGNLYGTTSVGGSGGWGTVFQLSPATGGWVLSVLHSFTEVRSGPGASAMDAAGNLYGTTVEGGAYGNGNVFRLAPSGNSWTYTSLHDFTGGTDGGRPFGAVILDMNGNIYGTAVNDGAYGRGVAFEITP